MSHGERWAGAPCDLMSHKIAPRQVNRGLRTARHARYPTFPRACRDCATPIFWVAGETSVAKLHRAGPEPIDRAVDGPVRIRPAAFPRAQLQLPGRLPGRGDPLDPDADQPDPRPVQLQSAS